MKILVTGAAGFIGSALSIKLLERGDKVVGIESRGFIFGSLLAQKLDVGFILARKPGKLPAETESETYQLEYGEDKIEIHKDAINKGDKILLHDDLLATGGTAVAAANKYLQWSLLSKFSLDNLHVMTYCGQLF